MTKDEALKLALWHEAMAREPNRNQAKREKHEATAKFIKEALAQPEQEPVYTHPAKDLEDIEINITWNENSMRDFGKDELNFARAILRKAQEK